MSEELTAFMHAVGVKLKKKPEAMQPFIDILLDNWYDSVDSLKEIDNDAWANMKIPSRLVKVIIEELNAGGAADGDEEMIDTSTKQKEPKQPSKAKDIHMQGNDDQEIVPPVPTQAISKPDNLNAESISDLTQIYITEFFENDKDVVCKSMKTLITVITNLIKNPWEVKFRSLDTSKKGVQTITEHIPLVAVLKLCGFEEKLDDSGVNKLELKGYQGELLNKVLDAVYSQLKLHGDKFGIKVNAQKFNPYEESFGSTTGNRMPKAGEDGSKYDPSHIDKMIEEEKQFKKKLMERKVEDRETKVFQGSRTGGTDFKKILREYDEENQKEEEAYEEKMRETSALKLLGENAK